MNRNQIGWIAAYRQKGALWIHDGNMKRPHALLTSGKHSNGFFNSRLVIVDEAMLLEAAQDLVELFMQNGGDIEKVDRVVGPQTGATKLAELVSNVIGEKRGRPCAWASPAKHEDGGKKSMIFDDPDRKVLPNERLLLCEDVLTTGGSVELTIDACLACASGVTVLPFILVLVNRSGKEKVSSTEKCRYGNQIPKNAPCAARALQQYGQKTTSKHSTRTTHSSRVFICTLPPFNLLSISETKIKNMNKLTPAARLVVAADNDDPTSLAETLKGTGIVFKENVGLREAGYDFRIEEIRDMGFIYFADLKLNDIQKTMVRDGKSLSTVRPDILTVMCSAPFAALQAIQEILPVTEVLGVTVLTDITDVECLEIYGRRVDDQVRFFAERALKAGLKGVVCAPKEIPLIREVAGTNLTINTPGIRSSSEPVKGDDQNPDRARSIREAFELGATRFIVGRPIIDKEDPLEATNGFIAEIQSALA
jgi:orotidine-5'-phosphate decarboxylase